MLSTARSALSTGNWLRNTSQKRGRSPQGLGAERLSPWARFHTQSQLRVQRVPAREEVAFQLARARQWVCDGVVGGVWVILMGHGYRDSRPPGAASQSWRETTPPHHCTPNENVLGTRCRERPQGWPREQKKARTSCPFCMTAKPTPSMGEAMCKTSWCDNFVRKNRCIIIGAAPPVIQIMHWYQNLKLFPKVSARWNSIAVLLILNYMRCKWEFVTSSPFLWICSQHSRVCRLELNQNPMFATWNVEIAAMWSNIPPIPAWSYRRNEEAQRSGSGFFSERHACFTYCRSQSQCCWSENHICVVLWKTIMIPMSLSHRNQITICVHFEGHVVQ